MNSLKSALIAASIVFAGPALANGGMSFGYIHNLTYPSQDVTVSQNNAKLLAPSGDRCTLLEREVGVQPDACGTISKSELVKRKLARDE
ncbi:hypothetical protein BCF46_2260 [Litoreibacter meonggei]|uniref:Uncharacterized protein n=1 Tax=Litoreibacter meonggei TaxID=1049199 RepID=A0A497W7S2_9RHOB|nr:hypothetical protein [Litoreibacter meonggei]RLJ52032.1 hypothetical protein BCF46_2260 [Litoreibacter meonggei]